MTHKQPLPKTILMLHIPLIVLLLWCCVALIGCPETDQMVGNVITPPADTPPPPPAQDTTENTPPPPPPPADTPPPPPPADIPPPPAQDTTGNTPPPPADTPPPPADTPTTGEPTVLTPEPLAPLPEGPVVFVAPRPLTSPAVGQQLKVSLNIKGAAGVSGYEVTVGFDSTALRYVESANADYLPAGAFVVPTQVTANSVRLGAVSEEVAPTAEGTLATVTFEVISAKASTLVLNPVSLLDANAQALPFTAVDGQINAP